MSTFPETEYSSSEKASSSLESPVVASADFFPLSDVDHKKLLRRADWRILPWVLATYCIVRLDLGNISNAGIMNEEAGHSLMQQLHLDAQQWAWCIASFYYLYMAVEPLSTFCVKLTSPSIWIGRIMVSCAFARRF